MKQFFSDPPATVRLSAPYDDEAHVCSAGRAGLRVTNPFEHATFEQILLRRNPGVRRRRRGSTCLLVFQEPFQYADRRVERGALARWRGTVPTAILELLIEKAVDQPITGLAETGAGCQDCHVNAGFGFSNANLQRENGEGCGG
jgi:hypothetical protein